MHRVWTFFNLVLAEWLSRVTGSLSAILVSLGLAISVAGAFGAKIPADFFSVWAREHQARNEAEAKLRPKLRVVYDPTKPPCHSVSTFSDGSTSTDGMVFRLEVENSGNEQITNCEGYLTSIAFEGESAELGVVPLTWAGMPSSDIKVNLLRGVKRHLDILIIYHIPLQVGQVHEMFWT